LLKIHHALKPPLPTDSPFTVSHASEVCNAKEAILGSSETLSRPCALGAIAAIGNLQSGTTELRKVFEIRAESDGEAGVWWCSNDELPLTTKAPNFEQLVSRALEIAPRDSNREWARRPR
jgi:hypothetical protein